MSRYVSSCKWCGDRPGGCLYCVNDIAENDEEKLLAVHQMIARGEVHVVAVRTTQEVLVRHIDGRHSRGSEVAAPRHLDHQWAYDGMNFKSRHCTHPGCKVVQRFVWLPEDPNANGKWVDVEPVQQKVAKATKRKAKERR